MSSSPSSLPSFSLSTKSSLSSLSTLSVPSTLSVTSTKSSLSTPSTILFNTNGSKENESIPIFSPTPIAPLKKFSYSDEEINALRQVVIITFSTNNMNFKPDSKLREYYASSFGYITACNIVVKVISPTVMKISRTYFLPRCIGTKIEKEEYLRIICSKLDLSQLRCLTIGNVRFGDVIVSQFDELKRTQRISE
jgi:hypothetical protein